jgi:hypothetical protein
VRHWPVGHAAIRVPAVRHPGTRMSSRSRTVGPAAVRRASARGDGAGRDSTRGEPARLARVRASRRAGPLLPGRHLARTAEQLPVVVFLGVYRSA